MIEPLVDTTLPPIVLDFAAEPEYARAEVDELKREVAALRAAQSEQAAAKLSGCGAGGDTRERAAVMIQTRARRLLARRKVAARRKLKGVGVDLGLDLDWVDRLYPLHWDPSVERRGLGWQIQKLNHIGLVCADIGRSVSFYADVLGLQQIQRPNFDRYGAWFTFGNIELHLTKGTPPTRALEADNDLITHHMALEIRPDQVATVKSKLGAIGVLYRQNLSVPRGDVKQSDANKDGPNKSGFDAEQQVVQLIFRDPDGYYIEIIAGGLTFIRYCFPFIGIDDVGATAEGAPADGGYAWLADYSNSHQEADDGKPPDMPKLAWMKAKQVAWTNRATEAQARLLEAGGGETRSEKLSEMLAKIEPATEVDAAKEAALHKRRNVYCDICQSFSAEELTESLKRCQNDVPLTLELLADIIRTERGGMQTFQPPKFLEKGVLKASLLVPASKQMGGTT